MTNKPIFKKARNFDKTAIPFLCIMLAIPLLNFCLNIYVNVSVFPLSFKDFNIQEGRYNWVGLRNYVRLLQEFSTAGSVFPTALRNSILFFILNNFILLPLSIIFSFFLNKKMPLANFFRIVFFLPSIISAVVLTMMFVFMFDSSIGFMTSIFQKIGLGGLVPEFGWFGDKTSAIILLLIYCFWTGIGGNILLLSGAINRIPPEVLEVGKIEGLSYWGELFRVVFPLIGSTIAVLFMQGVTVIFTMFLPVKLITNGGPQNSTYTLALYVTNSIRDDGNLTMGAAMGIMLTIVGTPIVIGVRKGLEKVFPDYEY